MFTIIISKKKLILEQLRLFFRIFISKRDTSILILLTKKIYVSRNIIFKENESYYKREINKRHPQESSNEFSFLKPIKINQDIIQAKNKTIPKREEELEPEIEIEENSKIDKQVEENSQNDEQQEENVEEVSLRRSNREIQLFTRLKYFLTYKVQYHIQNFITYENISTNQNTYLTSISKEQEPISFSDAIENPKWCKMMKEELRDLKKK
jgi:hypothetical protein